MSLIVDAELLDEVGGGGAGGGDRRALHAARRIDDDDDAETQDPVLAARDGFDPDVLAGGDAEGGCDEAGCGHALGRQRGDDGAQFRVAGGVHLVDRDGGRRGLGRRPRHERDGERDDCGAGDGERADAT